MTKQHLSCPFCGDRDIRSHHRGHPTSGEWVIECHSCPCELTGFATETEAWTRWNKRAELPESLRDPIKSMERGRELLDSWGPTPVTDAALASESPLARAVRIARGDVGPPTEPVRFSACSSDEPTENKTCNEPE